jgi:hypothetical protein
MAHPVVEGFRKEWPAAFAGPSLDKLSGNAFRWSTTQNRRSRGEIPSECFVNGRPTLVLRDPFLNWWATTLQDARQPFGKPARATPPTPRAVKTRRYRAAPAEPVALSASAPE